MANAMIIFCYVWAFSFLVAAVYSILKFKGIIEILLGTTIFGNSFSMIFWTVYVISSKVNGPMLANPLITILATISIILFISYITLIFTFRIKSDKYYSSYPN